MLCYNIFRCNLIGNLFYIWVLILWGEFIIFNVDNYATLAADIDDPETQTILIKTFATKLDNYASMFYYAPVKKIADGGRFINNLDWVAPEGFEPSERSWFAAAVENKGKVTFSSPYVDASTGDLCVTISQAVYGSSGKLKGVSACDILLGKSIRMITSLNRILFGR